MKTNFLHSRKGFTLVELMIAMTILGIMSVMTILIYFNISENSRRMQIARELNETARQITERIAEEIKKEGISPEEDENGALNILEISPFDQEKKIFLAIGKNDIKTKPKKYFLYGKKDDNTNTLIKCEDSDKNDPKIHCGLYLWENSQSYNLVDSFQKDEKSKRVKISDLQFRVSEGDTDTKKVTLKMTLELTQKSGVPPSLVKSSKMEIQTTFSERIYKIN